VVCFVYRRRGCTLFQYSIFLWHVLKYVASPSLSFVL
jgi:hypothetical protein